MLKELIDKKLETADVIVNGERPWDLQVKDPQFYKAVALHGSMGLGNSYVNGWIEANQLDLFFEHLLNSPLSEQKNALSFLRQVFTAAFINQQTKRRSRVVGELHYNLGNDLFKLMLDRRMVYSCGYWKKAKTLDEAQEDKLDLICQKLYLKPGMKVLDIGCGWGSFAKFAAERYQVEVVGVSISQEQVELGKQMCQGLPVDIRFQDYRDVEGIFDRVVSIGAFEHIGEKNYHTFMSVAAKCLKDDGLFLLHTIGRNRPTTVISPTDPWFAKNIFPNSQLPAASQIAKASEGIFIMEDWHNFGPDYDKTLMAWFHNFDNHWDELKDNYSESFYRMWKYYLLGSAAGFRTRGMQLWQTVFSKRGVPGGYQSVR